MLLKLTKTMFIMFFFQIECDICRVWYHAHCVGIGAIGILAIDKYHCPRCSPMCGPSILKPRTNTHRHDYTDPNATDLVKQVRDQH